MGQHSEAAELIDLASSLRDQALPILRRGATNSRGPINKNQIFNAVDLYPHSLSRLRNFPKSPNECVETITNIAKLFSNIVDGEALSGFNKESIIAEKERFLLSVKKYWRDLAKADSSIDMNLRRILELCKKLLDQIEQQKQASKDEVTPVSEKQLTARGQALFSGVRSITLAAIGFLLLASFGAHYIRSGQPSEVVPTATKKNYNMTESEALARLNVLWNNGTAFAQNDEDYAYLETMSKAKDLAQAIFGNNSKPYAQALNHMIGALWTNGRHEESIAVARESYALYSKLLGPNHPDVLNDQVNLGARLSGRPSTSEQVEAKQLLFGALTKYELIAKYMNVNLGMAHNHEAIAIYYLDRSQPALALIHSTISIKLVDLAGVRDRINRGWIIANHAGVLDANGDCVGAKAMFGKAIAAYVDANIPITQKDHAYSIERKRRTCNN
jgi:hypothetical protein